MQHSPLSLEVLWASHFTVSALLSAMAVKLASNARQYTTVCLRYRGLKSTDLSNLLVYWLGILEQCQFFSPPGNDSFGRAYVLLEFILFSSRNLRAPSADRREILHDARSCVQFYNPGPKFWQ